MLKKAGHISYHESCFNEDSENFKSLAPDCSGDSEIMQFKIRKMNNIAHEDLQVLLFRRVSEMMKKCSLLSFAKQVIFIFEALHWSNLSSCWMMIQ